MPVHRIRRECPFSAPCCSPWCRGRALPPFKRRLLGQFIGAGGHEVRRTSTQAHSMATSRSVQLAPRLAVAHQTPRVRRLWRANPSSRIHPLQRTEARAAPHRYSDQSCPMFPSPYVRCTPPSTVPAGLPLGARQPAAAPQERPRHRVGSDGRAGGRHGGPPPGRRPARPRRHRHLRPRPQPARLARRPPPPPQPIRPVKALSNGHRGRVRTSSDARDHREQ